MQPGIVQKNSKKYQKRRSKIAIDWFEMNDIIVNLDKFQAMIMSCDKKRKQI